MYDAVNKTITNYPLLQQRSLEVAASHAHIISIGDKRLPSFTLQEQLNAGTNNNLTGGFFPSGVIPSTEGGIENENNGTVSTGNIAIGNLQWELCNFGYYNAQRKEARAALSVSESQLNSDRYSLTENIISLYLDWLEKYRLSQIEYENVSRAATILTAIRATVISGLKPGVDSATASAAYADARISYLQSLDAYDNDKIALATYTGVNAAVIKPDTTIFNKVLQGDLSQVHFPDSIAVTHPLLDVYREQYRQQLVANNAIAKKYLPKIGFDAAAWMRGSSISATDVYDDNLANGFSYSRYNYLFGLTLTYNLFDLRHRYDELQEGRYEAKAKESIIKTQELSLNNMLQQANTTYATVTEKLKELPVELNSAQQAYGQQLVLYKAGLNTLIDVTNAQYVLRQTETNYVLAQDELLQLLYIRAGLNNQLDTFLQKFK